MPPSANSFTALCLEESEQKDQRINEFIKNVFISPDRSQLGTLRDTLAPVCPESFIGHQGAQGCLII